MKNSEIILAILLMTGISLTALGIYRVFHPPLTAKAESHTRHKLSPVVRLTTQAGDTFCTGIVVSPHTIITAGHCVLETVIFGMPIFRQIYIRDVDAAGPGVTAKVSSIRGQLDTATLEGDFDAFESRPVITDIAKLVEVAQSDAVFTSCGYPLGGPIYCSKMKYVGRLNFAWLMKGVLLPGMSGGPMMLDDGTVVAINDAVQDDFSIVVPLFNVPVEK
jgi:V8-like Glu-specific endopeptidase